MFISSVKLQGEDDGKARGFMENLQKHSRINTTNVICSKLIGSILRFHILPTAFSF